MCEYGCEGGASLSAANTGRQWADFDAVGENANQTVDVPDTEHRSGMWAQTRSVTQSNVGMHADSGGGFNRGWLDMDHVDPCQPTQAYNMGQQQCKMAMSIGEEHIVVECKAIT